MSRAPNWFQRRPYLTALIGGFAIAFGAAAAMFLPNSGDAPPVRVPSVVGLPFADAERRLRGMGLGAVVGREVSDDDSPRSAVVAQRPAAGLMVERDTDIELDVSMGDTRIAVPSVLGLTRDEAERVLVEAGFSVGDITEQPTDSARGIVLSSTPAGGELTAQRARIMLVISAGRSELTMPDVVGRDVDAARNMFEALGLPIDSIAYDSLSSLPAGTVVSQSPAALTAILAGTPVTLRVAGKQ